MVFHVHCYDSVSHPFYLGSRGDCNEKPLGISEVTRCSVARSRIPPAGSRGRSAAAEARRLTRAAGLKEPDEFLWCYACLPQDCPKRASVELVMIWNRYRCRGTCAAHDNMAALLTIQGKVRAGQNANDVLPGNDGELVHTQTTCVSKSSAGTGSPCAFADSIQPSMASRMF
jgi:hypothetical protein